MAGVASSYCQGQLASQTKSYLVIAERVRVRMGVLFRIAEVFPGFYQTPETSGP